jgi:energy-coupling factor transporter ATP-binding protein EcfA2
MVAINAPADLSSDLERLALSLDKLSFPEVPGEVGSGATRDRLVRAIRSYLLPRIQGPPGPLLVVFAGSTGTGKSTLLNSISGVDVSGTGPLRPTTREPVVLAADPERYAALGGVACATVGGSAPILSSMTFVDTPDIDSTSSRHRAVSEIMIDHADVVVFVSSAMRYGDLVPWEVMRRAKARGAPLLVVLNRVSTGTGAAVADFRRLLEREGLAGEVIVVHEHHLGAGAASVPSVAVRTLRRRLMAEAALHARQRSEIMSSVLWSTLGEARDLVAEADLALADRELTIRLIGELFTPLIDRLLLGMPGIDDHRLDLDGIAALGGLSAGKKRRKLRRLGPTPAQVTGARRRLQAALVVAVESDLQLAFDEGMTVAGSIHRHRVDRMTRQSIESAMTSWGDGVFDLVEDHDEPALATLLVEMAVVRVPGVREALGALVPSLAETIDEASTGLLAALRPVYGEARGRVAAELAFEAGERQMVDEARAALADAAALSAFANA